MHRALDAVQRVEGSPRAFTQRVAGERDRWTARSSNRARADEDAAALPPSVPVVPRRRRARRRPRGGRTANRQSVRRGSVPIAHLPGYAWVTLRTVATSKLRRGDARIMERIVPAAEGAALLSDGWRHVSHGGRPRTQCAPPPGARDVDAERAAGLRLEGGGILDAADCAAAYDDLRPLSTRCSQGRRPRPAGWLRRRHERMPKVQSSTTLNRPAPHGSLIPVARPFRGAPTRRTGLVRFRLVANRSTTEFPACRLGRRIGASE